MILVELSIAKAFRWNASDDETLKLGEQKGLGTLVVLAVKVVD